jgi:hypothetical protein
VFLRHSHLNEPKKNLILTNFLLETFFLKNFNYYFTEGSPNLSADRVRTVPYSSIPYRTVLFDHFPLRDRFGRPHSVPYFLTVFRDFLVKARTVPYQHTDHFSLFHVKKLKKLKSLIWWNLLEKREPYRDAFLYEKAVKTDICAVRFALTALFIFNK